MADPRRVAVVGGGITGLATAWYLRRGDAAPAVTLVEAGDRPGGKLDTAELAGVAVETGPDTFLARVPWATDLCRDLGLEDDLVAPATGNAFVWARDRLRPLPEGTLLGVPTDLGALVRSGALSAPGVTRAAMDLVRPRSRFGDDPSVAEVVRARLGPEALDVLVDPLVGGINAGRADRLGLRSTAPQVAEAAGSRSLILGARRQRRGAAAADGPLFLGVAGGMGRLVDRLEHALADVDVRPATRVGTIERRPERGYRLRCTPGPEIEADAVVLALPAFGAAEVLRNVHAGAAAGLDEIAYASVVVATLAYPPEAVAHALDGSGFLVPRGHRWLTTACTWSTSKWPALRRSGLVMLRASAGRYRDERAMELDDGDLVSRLHDELDRAVGLSERPAATLVTRWPRSFPQYEPGHEARVERIESVLAAELPGVFVTGAAYRGLGIAACVRQARETATQAAFSVRKRVDSGRFPHRERSDPP